MTFYLLTCRRNIKTLNRIKVVQIWLKRTFASPIKVKSKKYSHTITLPSSSFPAWIKKEERVLLDKNIEKVRLYKTAYHHIYQLFNFYVSK